MANVLYSPNAGKNITANDDGTTVALDVRIAQGSLTATFTEEATAADGAALPAKVKVSAGYDGSNVQALKTDANGELQVDVLSSALPTGAATESTLSTLNGKVTACDTGAVVVSSSALPSGAATAAKQDTGNTSLASIDGKITACDTGAVVVSSSALPTGASTAANQSTGNTSLSSIDGKFGSLGQKAMAGSAPVVIASDQSAIPASQSGTWTVQPGNTANTTPWLTKDSGASTSTLSNVSSSASTTSLLASNSSRRQATFFNDSTAILYLKFGTTASTTSYTVQIPSNGYYEMPLPVYTGAIDGIWASANGSARITEIT